MPLNTKAAKTRDQIHLMLAQSGSEVFNIPRDKLIEIDQALGELEHAFPFEDWLSTQNDWSQDTFGPHYSLQRVLKHIRKELVEIEAKPDDPMEWIDLIMLALDGANRCAHLSPVQVATHLNQKQDINLNREWPDWRERDPEEPIEHIRSKMESTVSPKTQTILENPEEPEPDKQTCKMEAIIDEDGYYDMRFAPHDKPILAKVDPNAFIEIGNKPNHPYLVRRYGEMSNTPKDRWTASSGEMVVTWGSRYESDPKWWFVQGTNFRVIAWPVRWKHLDGSKPDLEERPVMDNDDRFVGRTILAVEADAINNVVFHFTDGPPVALHIDATSDGLVEVATCLTCIDTHQETENEDAPIVKKPRT